MSVTLYDDALLRKIKFWIKDNNLTIKDWRIIEKPKKISANLNWRTNFNKKTLYYLLENTAEIVIFPSLYVALILPLWLSTIAFAIDNPNP